MFAIENGPFTVDLLIEMVIFSSSQIVSLPEGTNSTTC